MSMDVYLRLFLCSLLTAYTRAGPLSTASGLTPYLEQNTPTCAHPCLKSFVDESFPSSVCSSPSINCLCTSDSESGFTVGEGALVCLASTCPGWDHSEAVTAYGICGNIEGSMPNTHSIITETAIPTATDLASATTTTSKSSISKHSSISSKTSKHFSSSSASTSASTIDRTITTATRYSSSSASSSPAKPSSSSQISAAPAQSTSSTTPSPPTAILTKPQLAGVIVASTAAAFLAFGLCFLLFCCRRKSLRQDRERRRYSGSSFGNDKAVHSMASSPDMATIAARDFGHDPEGKEVVAAPQLSDDTPQTTGEGGWSQWRRNTAPQDIGLALAPTPHLSTAPSPVTPHSYRTNSQLLLPDKPSYSLFPAPLRPSPRSTRASQSLEALLAARGTPPRQSPSTSSYPRFPSALDTSHSHMQKDHISTSPSSPTPQIFPNMQHPRPVSRYNAYRPPHSSNTTPVWSEPPPVIRKPLPAQHSPSARGLRPTRNHLHQRPYLPPPPISTDYLTTTISDNQRGPPRRKKSDPRPITYLSTGSETSFEDDENEHDLPEPVSALSPARDQHPPVTYPRIPTTAAESPTRKPRMEEDVVVNGLPANPRPLATRSEVRDSAKWKILMGSGLEEERETASPRGAGREMPRSGWPDRR